MGVAAGAGRLFSESLQEPGVSWSRFRSRASLGVVAGAGRLFSSEQYFQLSKHRGPLVL